MLLAWFALVLINLWFGTPAVTVGRTAVVPPVGAPSAPSILAFGARPDQIDLISSGSGGTTVRGVACRIPQTRTLSVAIAGSRVFLLAGGPSNDSHLYEWNVATGEVFHVMEPKQLGSTFAIAAINDDLFARDNDGVARIDLRAGTLTQILSLPWTPPSGEFFQTPIHTGFAATQTELAFLAAPGVVGFLNPQTGHIDRIVIDGVSRVTSAIHDAAHVQCGMSFRLIDRSPSRTGGSRWSGSQITQCNAVFESGGSVWGVKSGDGYSPGWLVNLDNGGAVQLKAGGGFGIIPLPANVVP